MFKRFVRDWRAQEQDAVPDLSVTDALLTPRPSDVFVSWARHGLLRQILPDLDALRGVSQLPAHRDDAFVHTLKVVDAIEPLPIRRWAALLHDIGKGPTYIETPEGRSRFFEHDKFGAAMVPEIMGAAAADAALIEPVERLVRLHMRPISYGADWTDSAVRRLFDEAQTGRGPQGWTDLLALARADLRGYLPEPIDRGLWVIEQLETRCAEIQRRETEASEARGTPDALLGGHDLQVLAKRGPGPWLGQLKSYLLGEIESGRLAGEDVDLARALALDWLNRHPPAD